MAIVFKPQRITETNRAKSTRALQDGELIIATTGSAFGSNRCNIYIGDGTTQLKSLTPAIVGSPPLKWVSSATNLGKNGSCEFSYWDSDTGNYYLRMIQIMAHIGPDSTNQNALVTIVVADPKNAFTMDGNRSVRGGYYLNETAGCCIAYKITKSPTDSPTKIVITHDSTDTLVNKSGTYVLTWTVKALYQYEKYKTPV